MNTAHTDARFAAIQILDRVLGDKMLLSDALNAPVLARLAPQERARAQRLATSTLRGLERSDRLLGKHLRKPPPLSVRNALRLGTQELAEGGAAHGVVNAMVTITAQSGRHRALKGLVNAVLRKVAAGMPEAWHTLRVPRLPKWLRTPLTDAWGRDCVTAMEAAHFAGAATDITFKPGQRPDIEGAQFLPTGSLRLQGGGQISSLPSYGDGTWWVQDAAAAIPARVLAPRKGERILDMCAAPGGKTLQLASAGADVVALDLSPSRLDRVRDNLARTGLTAEIVAEDALEHAGRYDAILLDAPCSATGTIRRHPDLPLVRDGAEFAGLIDLQARMLAHGWTLLKPGGRLVFCTCSLLPDEGEVQVQEAIAAHADMRVDREALALPGIDPAWISAEGGLRLRPDFWADLGGMDGFYVACLVKEGPGAKQR